MKKSMLEVVSAIAKAWRAEPGNSEAIIEEAADEVIKLAQDDGLIETIPDGEQLRREYVKRQIKAMVRNRQQQMKRDLDEADYEQPTLDLGDDFDSPVLVCGNKALTRIHLKDIAVGRITTMGGLTERDAELMDVEQQIDLEEKVRARQRMRAKYTKLRNQIRPYGTYEAWKRSAP